MTMRATKLAQHAQRRSRAAPGDDPKRLQALRATGLLDSPPEEGFDLGSLCAIDSQPRFWATDQSRSCPISRS